MPEDILSTGLTTAQVGRLIGVTPKRVTQLIKAGRLPFIWTPLGRLMARADVEAFIEKRALVHA